ncbi:MAG: DUF2059 domain-containing protein [Rhodobacterales bacterium]
MSFIALIRHDLAPSSRSLMRLPLICVAALMVWLLATFAALAQGDRVSDQARLKAFLSVTGFDTALDSIALSAGDAPLMLGRDASEFGADWSRTVADVFDADLMRDLALDILDRALTEDLLTHAVDFYASDLGQRLVAVENAAHMADDSDIAREQGGRIIADLLREGAPRLTILQRMGPAIDPDDSAVRAVEEIQLRFLLSASAAGVVAMELDEPSLRAVIADQRNALRLAMRESGLAQSAYVYRSFSDAELETYVAALEHPVMQRVYELMNAIQYEIMANRFEVLARRMADLHPGEEL